MSYQGWTNWETWNVVLWCDNEEAIYRARIRREPRTADEIESFVKDWMPEGTPDFDKTDGGYAAVDWDEIADHWSEDYEPREAVLTEENN